MSGKVEKVFKAIKRINQDILPTQIDYTPEMKSIIKRINPKLEIFYGSIILNMMRRTDNKTSTWT